MPRITIKWSKLIPFTDENIEKVKSVSGVYRISKKSGDGEYYVFFVGSAENIGKKLLSHKSSEESNTDLQRYLLQGGDISFRYAVVEGEEERKAIEKQMFRYYLPEYNFKEPKSSLNIEANLN